MFALLVLRGVYMLIWLHACVFVCDVVFCTYSRSVFVVFLVFLVGMYIKNVSFLHCNLFLREEKVMLDEDIFC